MIKTLLRSALLVLGLLLLNPTQNQAQVYCPMSVYNNNQYVGLVNTSVYNTFVDGDYWLTMFSTNLPCFIINETVHFTRTTNVSNYIPGAPAAAGVVFNFSGTACNGELSDDIVQAGGFSMSVVRPSDGVQVFTLNYTDNSLDECLYTPLPVIFASNNISWTTFGSDLRLQWTTNDETNMDHFSIEKMNGTTGNTWVKVAQFAAHNTAVYNYEWHDYAPLLQGIYRIVGVDINCKKTYSPQMLANCSSCSSSWTPPSLTPDCSVPVNGPALTGPASICDNNKKLYRLTNITGEVNVTWSLSPSSYGSLSKAGKMAVITPNGTPGIATLGAVVVKNGQTTTYSKDIVFGTPPLTGSIDESLFHDALGSLRHEVTIDLLPGTTGNDYSWYQSVSWNPGFTYVGTGASHYWIIQPGDAIDYEVYWNGPCGQSLYTGNGTWYPIEGRMAAPVYTISPNPAKGGNINITIKKPKGAPSLKPSPLNIFSAGRTTEVQIYDMYGNFKKSVKVAPGTERITINAPELPNGLYYLHVTEPGRKIVTLKAWIEK